MLAGLHLESLRPHARPAHLLRLGPRDAGRVRSPAESGPGAACVLPVSVIQLLDLHRALLLKLGGHLLGRLDLNERGGPELRRLSPVLVQILLVAELELRVLGRQNPLYLGLIVTTEDLLDVDPGGLRLARQPVPEHVEVVQVDVGEAGSLSEVL